MQPELALNTISHTEIAIFLVTLLFVLLISLRKELSGEAPLRGVFQFGFVIIGLCTVVALMAGFFKRGRWFYRTPTRSDSTPEPFHNLSGRQHESSRTLGPQPVSADI